MIYILYGPDTYRSRGKLHEIVEEYRKKAGASFDFHRVDAEESDLASVKTALETQSLFGGKKLVVVERGFSSGKGKEILALIERVKEEPKYFFIVWDEEVEKEAKKELSRALVLAQKSQEFEILKGEKFRTWILREAKKRGVPLSQESLVVLEGYEGNLWRIANELDRLALGGEKKGIGSFSTSIFSLGDTFFTSRATALWNLLSLLKSGEDPMGLFSYLSNHARTLTVLKYFSENGKPLPPGYKIHPFVAKKSFPLVRTISFSNLVFWVSAFFREDKNIKTGESKPDESLFQILFSGKR